MGVQHPHSRDLASAACLDLLPLDRSSFGQRATLVGALGCVMSGREFETDLLSAFALTIGSALGVGLPLTILIIWVCS
jgi:hypothetical protein